MVIDTLKLLTSDNVDYANKKQDWSGTFVADGGGSTGVFKNGSFRIKYNISGDHSLIYILYEASYGNSNNETRPKSKFFSLLIYAGYPA